MANVARVSNREFNQSTVRLALNPCGFEATVRRATVTVCESCNTCLVPEVRYLIRVRQNATAK